jgi:hypothetical protein
MTHEQALQEYEEALNTLHQAEENIGPAKRGVKEAKEQLVLSLLRLTPTASKQVKYDLVSGFYGGWTIPVPDSIVEEIGS